MNDARRRQIRAVIEELRKGTPDIDAVRGVIEDVQSEEEDARDNIPENLQETDRYMVCEESCEALEEAIDALDDDVEAAVEVLSQIDGV